MFRRRRVEVHAPPPERMKLILVVNAGLKMSKGKIAAQGPRLGVRRPDSSAQSLPSA